MPGTIVKAQQAEAVTEATSLLDRVERLMQESEAIVAAPKLERNWTGATAALRQARGCIELLGKLRGELQTGTKMSIGVALNVQDSQPKTEADLELAMLVTAPQI